MWNSAWPRDYQFKFFMPRQVIHYPYDGMQFKRVTGYDVYGYLENAVTGATQQLFYNQSATTNGWVNTNSTVSSSVCPSGTCGMRFRFLAGTFDETCGRAVGSTLYIDGISVVTSTATDAAVDYIVEHLEYQNTSNSPNANKTFTLTMQDSASSRDSFGWHYSFKSKYYNYDNQ